jgi:hypothetical protein
MGLPRASLAVPWISVSAGPAETRPGIIKRTTVRTKLATFFVDCIIFSCYTAIWQTNGGFKQLNGQTHSKYEKLPGEISL